MTYELQSMGMTPVRAASGICAGVPGLWWSRAITPEGEARWSERAVSRNLAHRIGGGPLHFVSLFYSHPIGKSTDYPEMRAVGTDVIPRGDPTLEEQVPRRPDVVDPIRSIRTSVTEMTGSRKAGEVVSCAAYYGVPGMARSLPVLAMIPIALGAGMYWWQRRKGTEKGVAVKYGLATWIIAPFAWCLLGSLIPPVRG